MITKDEEIGKLRNNLKLTKDSLEEEQKEKTQLRYYSYITQALVKHKTNWTTYFFFLFFLQKLGFFVKTKEFLFQHYMLMKFWSSKNIVVD